MVNFIANPIDFDFLYDLDLDQDVIRRLSLHLTLTYNGNDQVYTSPYLKDRKPEVVLAQWDAIFDANKSRMNDILIDLEMSNRDKYGPRSIAASWPDRRSLTLDYFKDSGTQLKLLPIRKDKHHRPLRGIPVEHAIKHLKNDTNSGLPYYTRKGKVKDRLRSRFSSLLLRKDPCILFTRTQEGGKTRTVWGFPIADTLNEMRYFFPLLEFQKKLSWRSALHGPDKTNDALTTLIRRAVENNLSIISIDFSAYDATVGKELQRHAFDYIKSLFQTGFKKDLEYIEERFNTIGLISPDGVLKGSHGVPSGSTFTNEVDSIVQYIVAINSRCVPHDFIQVQGDDGVYALPADKIYEFFQYFKKSGLKLNEEKSYVSKDYAVYLQNLYHNDYYDKKNSLIGGIYPVYRALNRILFQERWYDFEDFGLKGKEYYAIRTISILENCKYHPLFKELVHFVLKLDKYSLIFTDYGVKKYVEMLSSTQGTSGVLNNQYSDNVSGIKEFETVKLIKQHKF